MAQPRKIMLKRRFYGLIISLLGIAYVKCLHNLCSVEIVRQITIKQKKVTIMRELIEIYESGYSDSDINDMLISDPDILKLSDNYIIYIVREKDKDRWLHTGDGLDLIEIERVISMFESGDLKVSSDQTLNKPRYFAYRGGAGYHYCVYDI